MSGGDASAFEPPFQKKIKYVEIDAHKAIDTFFDKGFGKRAIQPYEGGQTKNRLLKTVNGQAVEVCYTLKALSLHERTAHADEPHGASGLFFEGLHESGAQNVAGRFARQQAEGNQSTTLLGHARCRE